MHIPDGFLTPQIWIPLEVIGVGAIFWSAKKIKETISQSNLPLLGVLGGFVFAAQMINIPVAPGTSGHLVGSFLLMLSVGGWGALFSMAGILLIQALFFQDGGITAWGANFFNMGILNLLLASLLYKFLNKILKFKSGESISIGISAWFGIVAASFAASLELVFSGMGNPKLIITTMLIWHILIGLIEGIATIFIWKFIKRVTTQQATDIA